MATDDEAAAGQAVRVVLRATTVVDYNIHGVVAVRFVDAPVQLTERFERQWRPCLQVPAGGPDVTVRFADLAPSPLTHVGLRWAATDDEHYYLLDEVDATVTALIPIADLGSTCEIVCRRGVTSVPFLSEVLVLAFLGKGYVPLHGSAFVHEGVGVVAMGWPKGGKTGALLSFMAHGATYVGDEWVVLAPDADTVLGLPLPLGVSEWQLKHMGAHAPRVRPQKRLMFQAFHLAGSLAVLLARGPLARSEPVKLLRKGIPALRRQLKVTQSPHRWFGDDLGSLTASAHRFFLLTSHDGDGILVQRHEAAQAARSMVSANEHEWRPLLDHYRGFTFAFPDSSSPLLENLTKRLENLLTAALAGKAVYRVLHPYGGPLDALFQAMEPHCRPE